MIYREAWRAGETSALYAPIEKRTLSMEDALSNVPVLCSNMPCDSEVPSWHTSANRSGTIEKGGKLFTKTKSARYVSNQVVGKLVIIF